MPRRVAGDPPEGRIARAGSWGLPGRRVESRFTLKIALERTTPHHLIVLGVKGFASSNLASPTIPQQHESGSDLRSRQGVSAPSAGVSAGQRPYRRCTTAALSQPLSQQGPDPGPFLQRFCTDSHGRTALTTSTTRRLHRPARHDLGRLAAPDRRGSPGPAPFVV